MERFSFAIVFWSVSCSSCVGITRANERTQLTATQWVSADSDDFIRVRVEAPQRGRRGVPVPKASVTLIGPNGFRRSAVTDPDGSARFKDVAPGVYATVVRTEVAFGCLCLHVIDRTSDSMSRYSSTFIMPIGCVSAKQFSEIVEPYLPTLYSLESLSVDSSTFPFIEEQIRDNEDYAIQRIEGGFSGTIFQPTDHGVQRVAEDVQDSLDPSEFASVFLYQDSRRIRHALTDEDGRFSFRYVNPGVYTVVSAGSDGIGCMSFELCEPEIQTGQVPSARDVRFVSRKRRIYRRLAMQVVPWWVVEAVPSPVGGSGAAGGSGGLGLARAAAATIIATSSGDGDPFVPPPAASPDTIHR